MLTAVRACTHPYESVSGTALAMVLQGLAGCGSEGPWDPPTPRAPPSEDGWVYEPNPDWESLVAGQSPDRPISSEDQEPGKLRNRDTDEFLANVLRRSEPSSGFGR